MTFRERAYVWVEKQLGWLIPLWLISYAPCAAWLVHRILAFAYCRKQITDIPWWIGPCLATSFAAMVVLFFIPKKPQQVQP